jgi:hypothetical protein
LVIHRILFQKYTLPFEFANVLAKKYSGFPKQFSPTAAVGINVRAATVGLKFIS